MFAPFVTLILLLFVVYAASEELDLRRKGTPRPPLFLRLARGAKAVLPAWSLYIFVTLACSIVRGDVRKGVEEVAVPTVVFLLYILIRAVRQPTDAMQPSGPER